VKTNRGWPHPRSPAPIVHCRSSGVDPRPERPVPSDARCEDLLAQNVRVAAMLGEFPEHVQVDPPQRQGAAPVAPDKVVKIEGSGPTA